MKNIFTLLLSTLIGLSLFAADVAGRVTVSFYGNNNYRVYIDGHSISSNNNRVYLNDLRPGRHTIEVYELKRNNKRSNKPVHTNNFIVKPQYDLNIIVDRNGYVRFDEDRNNRNSNDRNWKNRDRDDDRDRNRDKDYDRDRTYDRDKDYDRDRGYDRNRDYNRDKNYGEDRNWNSSRAMSETDFNQFVQKIRNQWFSKMNTAKDGLKNNYFTTSQVRQVVQIFTSENDKLELAKEAYSRTVDTRNFSQLYDLFSSQGRDELDGYVRRR